ncbi:MAG: hypothetical protein ACE5FO_09255 [Parvularculaceae bacterium]
MRFLINLLSFAVMFSLCWLATDNLLFAIALGAGSAGVSELGQRIVSRRQ